MDPGSGAGMTKKKQGMNQNKTEKIYLFDLTPKILCVLRVLARVIFIIKTLPKFD